MLSAPAATDQARDLDRLSAEIAELEQPPGPAHAEQATRLASCRVNRASLSGDVSEMRRAAAAVDAALARFGPWPDLCYLRAGVDLKQHRLADAVASLGSADRPAHSPHGRAVRAHPHPQLGRDDQAPPAYQRPGAATGAGGGRYAPAPTFGSGGTTRPAVRTSGWSPRRARGTASRGCRTSSRRSVTRSGQTRSLPRPPTRSPPRSFAPMRGSRRTGASCTS